MHARSTREYAVQLRKEGYPYLYISQRAGLSKSTLSGWLTHIPYTPNQETIDSLGKARAAAGERKAKLRQIELEELRIGAAKEVGTLNDRDLFMFGLGLYLGEGGKTVGQTRIVNSDPRVIKAAASWFLLLGASRDQFDPRIHLYPDNNIQESISFWSEVLGIPNSQFKKSFVDTRLDKKTNNQGKLLYGTLHLGVRSLGRKEYGVMFLRMIQAWYDEVLNQTKRD